MRWILIILAGLFFGLVTALAQWNYTNWEFWLVIVVGNGLVHLPAVFQPKGA